MNELRRDRISGQRVIIAPGRNARPQQVRRNDQAAPQAAHDAECPFCPGNEVQLPGILAEYPGRAPPGWSVRAVPNKYAALTYDAGEPPKQNGFAAEAAPGIQEVIIDSPRHNARLIDLNGDELLAVLQAYRDRYTALIAQERIAYVILFRNEGASSGASLSHPHSQLIATGFMPDRIGLLEERARDYFARNGTCIVCDDVASEISAASRIVERQELFTCHVPFAAQGPSELRITPVRHQSRFDEIDDAELVALGSILMQSLLRLTGVYGDLSYNFLVESAGREGKGQQYLHWYLRIVPDLVSWGGFELGTGIPINPSSPEQDAAALKLSRNPS